MTRRSIDIASLKHGAPIPAATRIGPLVTCSIVHPYNVGTRHVPETLEAQIDNLFVHVGQMLHSAGATWDDVAKMTFYVVNPTESRRALNGPWLERFPDAESRPSRHNLSVPDSDGPIQISCDFIAYVER